MLTCYLNSFREAHKLPDGMHITCVQILDDLDIPTHSSFTLLYLYPFNSLPPTPSALGALAILDSDFLEPTMFFLLPGPLYILFLLPGTLSSPPHIRISRIQLMWNRLQKALLISHCWVTYAHFHHSTFNSWF